MSLPTVVRRRVEQRVGAIHDMAIVGGGSISSAVRLDTETASVFLKYNSEAPAGLFASEAEGLSRMRMAAGGLRVPEVLEVWEAETEGTPEEPSWILLEWLEPASRREDYEERLGRGLAQMHRHGSDAWGWERDGFIGTLPQSNRITHSWADFWRTHRLEPQLRRAREGSTLPGEREEWDWLFAMLPDLIQAAQQDGPSLLHGDLWGGNVLAVDGGVPALIDPSVYFGHREVDLAMSELFGGFGARFYEAYREDWPLQPGYEEWRRPVYQLYYLLVHVNLFGGSYVARTRSVLRQILSAL